MKREETTVIREWLGVKLCGQCWNYSHGRCAKSGCDCGCIVEAKRKARELVERLDLFSYDWKMPSGHYTRRYEPHQI